MHQKMTRAQNAGGSFVTFHLALLVGIVACLSHAQEQHSQSPDAKEQRWHPVSFARSTDEKIKGLVVYTEPVVGIEGDERISDAQIKAIMSFINQQCPEWAIYNVYPPTAEGVIAEGCGDVTEATGPILYRPSLWSEKDSLYAAVRTDYTNVEATKVGDLVLPIVILAKCEIEKQLLMTQMVARTTDGLTLGYEVRHTPPTIKNHGVFPTNIACAIMRYLQRERILSPEWGLYADAQGVNTPALLCAGVVMSGSTRISYHLTNTANGASITNAYESDGQGMFSPALCDGARKHGTVFPYALGGVLIVAFLAIGFSLARRQTKQRNQDM